MLAYEFSTTKSPSIVAPVHFPRAHFRSGKAALDARTPERAEHHAVELADTVDRDRPRRRAERGHDPGEEAIALLPVAAGHPERHLRSLAVGRGALERDEGVLGENAARLEAQRFGIERIRDVTGDGDRRQRRVRAERPGDQVAIARVRRRVGGELRSLQAADRRERGRARSAPLDVTSQRPRHLVVAAGAPGEAHAARLVEIRQRIEIDVAIVHVEHRARRLIALAERRHQVLEVGLAAVEIGGGARHLHPIAHPHHRSLEIRESIVVDAGQRAREVALQLAAALEHVERAGEVALAEQRELVAREENLALLRELDLRLDLIELLGTVPEIDDAGHASTPRRR